MWNQQMCAILVEEELVGLKIKMLVILGALLLSAGINSLASPVVTSPMPNGQACSTYIHFNGFMGCIPLFSIEVAC